jgi:YjbE family integral membrane protein
VSPYGAPAFAAQSIAIREGLRIPKHQHLQAGKNRHWRTLKRTDPLLDSTQFISALLAIIVIDLVLAGDNAIVIALAARGLPAHLQKHAIVWGAVGAIGVRSVMTAIVVWLLRLPGLMLVGGTLLLWIAYRLLLSRHDQDEAHGRSATTTFWGAICTIVIADAVMGLDNVLAVAGAAQGSYLLIVTGLVVSVPLVVWGSTLVLKVAKRCPGVVYVGAGVLLWTAVKMITDEKLMKPWLEAMPVLAGLAYLAIPLVLWAGFVKNHRQLESRLQARLAELGRRHPQGAGPAPSSARALGVRTQGDAAMLKVLVPIDGSANALRAVRHAIAEYRRDHELELHLLNVQPRLSRHITRFVSRRDREAWLHDRATAAMAGAVAVLSQAGVPYHLHWAVGNRGAEICGTAERLRVHRIVMGIARKNSITRMFEDSVTEQVLEATPVPVELVVGDAVSKWERWGLPVGVLAGGGLLLAALD